MEPPPGHRVGDGVAGRMVLGVGVAIGTAAPTPVLFVAALCVTGTGRFVASGLSAALPHTIAATAWSEPTR